jgi:hypothetical protein
MNISKLISQLERGELPAELDYSDKPENIVDLEKLLYNSFYRSYEYYESKFPKGYENIPGFDKVIESMLTHTISNDLTPLKAIEQRQDESIISNIKNIDLLYNT